MLKVKAGNTYKSEHMTTLGQEKKSSFLGISLELIICLVVGFVLTDTVVGGARSPVAVSFVAALPLFSAIAAFSGSILSAVVNSSMTEFLCPMIAMLVLIVSNLLINDIIKKELSFFIRAAFAGISCFLSEFVITFSSHPEAIYIVAMVVRGMLCGLATYFISKVIWVGKKTPQQLLYGDNIVSVGVVYVLLICAMCSISLGLINIGRIFGIVVILITAFKMGYKGSSVTGILTSFGIILASSLMGRDTMLLAAAGLAAGLFMSGGKVSTASVFLAVNMLGIVLMGALTGSERFASDIIIATALFFVIPEKWYSRFFIGVGKIKPSVSQLLESRIEFVEKTIKDVRQSTDRAGVAFERRAEKSDISASVCSKVCSVCRDSMFCCESDLHRAVSYFTSVEATLCQKGFITEKDLPKGLEHCARKDKLVSCFNKAYKQSELQRRTSDTYAFLREMSLEQMITTEDMLKSINEGMTELAGCDDVRTGKARNILVAYGAKFPVVSVMQDDNGRLFIEAYIKGMIKGDILVVRDKICSVFEREFDEPVITSIDKVTRICFNESPAFDVDIGMCKMSGGEETSGDTQTYFSDGKGRIYFIISDGMGSGARAAVESCMTVSLLKKLLLAGVGYDCAFRIINLILLTKSPDEMFATIDLLCVNTYTGQADIIKLGAAQSFVKTNGIIKAVESYSTPVGIINSVEYEHRTTYLQDGDCIVMLSDGIREENFALIKECMNDKKISAAKSATRVIENCIIEEERKEDDKSIFVIKINKI